jgi:predicted transcriptional regulator of viral defense system
MSKNIYLTPMEQRILNGMLPRGIVRMDEIHDSFPGLKSNQINKACSSMSSKGYLHRLKRGVYLVQKNPSETPTIENPYQIALTLFKGYIGFSSALKVYGLIDYEPFNILVVTQNKSASRSIGEYTFRSVAMGGRATGMTFSNGVYVSTLTKTFFDCFHKPQYAGGYSTITKALFESDMDWNEFIGWFDLASSSTCQRTGYVLDILRMETNKVPQHVLNYLKSRIKNNTKLIPSNKSRGEYNKAWMVLDNLGKSDIMSWWYRG